MERTLVIIKPDGISRSLVGEIISRFERTGLKIEALKMMQANIKLLDKHYPETQEWLSSVGEKVLKMYKEYKIDTKKELGTADPVEIGKMVKRWTIDYLMEGLVVVMILSGYHAVENVRKLVGYTYPLTADVGSIRGDFCLDSPMYANLEKRAIRNLVHASGTPKDAEFEIKLWFSDRRV